MAYTLEWGTEFYPLYSEMHNIIQEITAWLIRVLPLGSRQH
jgi:hypothetical protein